MITPRSGPPPKWVITVISGNQHFDHSPNEQHEQLVNESEEEQMTSRRAGKTDEKQGKSEEHAAQANGETTRTNEQQGKCEERARKPIKTNENKRTS